MRLVHYFLLLTLTAGFGCSKDTVAGHDAGGDSGSMNQDSGGNDGAVGDGATGSDASVSCTLSHTFIFGSGGGFINSQTTAQLSPTSGFQITTTQGGPQPTETSCMPPLPACGDANAIDLADIVADLAHADVVAALATTNAPLFGAAVLDAGVFLVTRDDGKSFSVAPGDCGTTLPPDCVPTPAGVAQLVADLSALEAAGVADAACAGL
jgi:hypothetical protein